MFGRRLSFMAAAAALLVVLGYAIYVGSITTDVRIQSVALGVVGSLIAAIVFATLSEWTDSPQSRAQAKLDGAASRIEGLWERERDRVREGLMEVVEKREHDPDFWFGVLRRATDRLDMAGHALSGWVGGAYQEELKLHVRRILRAGGRVRVLVMDADGASADELSILFERNYRDRTAEFLALVEEVGREIKGAGSIAGLEVRTTRDRLGYMMIDNGLELCVSPYMSVSRAVRPMVLRISAESRFASDYRADFGKLFERSRPIPRQL